jgi:hypothetical protein
MNNEFCFWRIGEDGYNNPNQFRPNAKPYKLDGQYAFSDEHGAKPSFD